MFGYLIPYKNELKVKDLNLWQAAYCGVCHAMAEKVGQLPRLALQNDMASLALMLIDLSGESFETYKKACPAHVINRRAAVKTNESLIYCGDVTALLTHHKLTDMWRDEKKLYAPPAKLMISRGVRRAKRRNPALARELNKIMNELYAVEKDAAAYYDVPAALSGELMYAVAQNAKNIGEKEKTALSEMMKNLGMWIYLADAMEDMAHDIKKGCYNPFLKGKTPDIELIKSAKEVMTFALSRAMLAYDLLPLEKSAPVMDNIIRYSLPIKQNAIFAQADGLFEKSDVLSEPTDKESE